MIAELDGVRGVEWLTVRPDFNLVTALALEGDGLLSEFGGEEFESEGVCATSRCIAVQLDDDPEAELAWLDEQGALHLTEKVEPGASASVLDNACEEGKKCGFFEMDGSPGAEWVAWSGDVPEVTITSLGNEGVDMLSIDCKGEVCDFADVDGDGRADIVQWNDSGASVWTSRSNWEEPKLSFAKTCDTSDRRVWADANGDGHDDLFCVEASGAVSYYPNVDARGRLEAATLALSTVRVDAESAYRGVFRNEGVMASPPSAAEFEMLELGALASVEAAIEELLDAMVVEDDIGTDEEFRALQESSMLIAIGRAVIGTGAVGVSSRADGCANVILHERGLVDGALLQAPSYLYSYAKALRETEHADQVVELVDALTAISGGFRCLNNGEVARFDRSFSQAILTTSDELYSLGYRLAPKLLIDNALPIVLLTFDAAKYSNLPESYRLLTSRVVSGVAPGLSPGDAELGDFDFDSSLADPACETFVCQTYGNPRRADAAARRLMLDRIGVWLPDFMRSGRLVRIDVDSLQFLEALQDLRRLGEGDCSLFESTIGGFACSSRRTCDAEGLVDSGGGLVGAAPGMAGSAYTHLRTPRLGLPSRNGCDGDSDGVGATASGGAAVEMPGCLGPALASRSGRFSPDPALDRMMECALELGDSPVDLSVDVGDFCISGQTGGDDGDDGAGDGGDSGDSEGDGSGEEGGTGGGESGSDSSEPTPEQMESFELAKRALGDCLRLSGCAQLERMVEAFVARYGDNGGKITAERVRNFLLTNGAYAIENATAARLVDALAQTVPGEHGTSRIEVDVVGAFERSGGDALGAAIEMGTSLAHEVIHVASLNFEFTDGLNRSDDADHEVTDALYLWMCADENCHEGCGPGDAMFRRFAECMAPEGAIDPSDIHCQYGQDVCGDRRQGGMGFPIDGACTPELPESATNPECYVVQCGEDDSALANACCAAEAASGPVPTISTYFGPGPRPPRPMFESFVNFDGLPNIAGI